MATENAHTGGSHSDVLARQRWEYDPHATTRILGPVPFSFCYPHEFTSGVGLVQPPAVLML